MEAYYYSKMDKTKQAAYHAMLQGLLALEDSIPMPRLEAEDLYQVFFLLRLDHPEIFWATGFASAPRRFPSACVSSGEYVS